MSELEEETPVQEESDPSIQQTIALLKASAADYANSRKELVAIEAQEAKQNLITKATSIAIMAFTGLLAYLLFIVFIIGLGSSLLDKYSQDLMGRLWELCEPWIFLTFLACILHVIILLSFLDRLTKVSKKKLFPLSIAELQNDKEWLAQNKSNKES